MIASCGRPSQRLDHDLSSLVRGAACLASGRLPAVIPTFYHEDDGAVFHPGRWRKAVEKWGDRDDDLIDP